MKDVEREVGHAGGDAETTTARVSLQTVHVTQSVRAAVALRRLATLKAHVIETGYQIISFRALRGDDDVDGRDLEQTLDT